MTDKLRPINLRIILTSRVPFGQEVAIVVVEETSLRYFKQCGQTYLHSYLQFGKK